MCPKLTSLLFDELVRYKLLDGYEELGWGNNDLGQCNLGARCIGMVSLQLAECKFPVKRTLVCG